MIREDFARIVLAGRSGRFAVNGSVYLLPQYLTVVQGYDAFQTGQTMIWVRLSNCT
jgi:hypothetical protein